MFSFLSVKCLPPVVRKDLTACVSLQVTPRRDCAWVAEGWGEGWVIAELLLSPLGAKAKPFPDSQSFWAKRMRIFPCPNSTRTNGIPRGE